MIKIILIAVLCLPSAAAFSDQYVKPHIRSDGTYVGGYYRSSPNRYKFDNYSSQGNRNPYTGQRGYRRHEYSAPSYGGDNYFENKGYNGRVYDY